MKTLAPDTIAALNARELSIVQLIYMQFPGFPVALNSSNSPFDFGGVTYRGAAGLGTVGTVDDSPGEVKGLQLEISGAPIEYIALALADSTIVQGAPLTIRLGIVNDAGQIIEAPIDWDGRIDIMSIQEDGDTCTIAVTSESTAVDLLRGTPMTYSNVDQQALYPGDRAFEFVIPQANQKLVWPAKQWLLSSAGR